MFERYTEKARRVIFFARYEASAAGMQYIDDEHLLLGLLRESKGQLARICGSLEVVSAVEDETRAHMTRTSENVSTSVDLPLSRSSQEVLRKAAEEAESFHHRHIGTEHLVLGLLHQKDTLATHILNKHGLSLAKARDVVAQMTDSSFRPAAEQDAAKRARIDQAGTVEFVSSANEVVLAKSGLELIGHVPRIGEEVILTSGATLQAYRVRDVTYVYLKVSEEIGVVPQKLAKIVIRVEPAGQIRGAQWEAVT